MAMGLLKKSYYTFLFFAVLSTPGIFAQLGGGNTTYSITDDDPNPVFIGDSRTYNLNGDLTNVFNTDWNINSNFGTINSSTPVNCIANFTAAGDAFVGAVIEDYFSNTYLAGISVTVIESLDPGGIGGTQTVCYSGVTATLSNNTSASGGLGNYEYQWEYSNTGFNDWSEIAGALSATYNPSDNLTASRWYRRRVDSGSIVEYSNVIKVTVNPNLVAGGINGAQTLCYNGNPSTLSNNSSPLWGDGNYEYRWQKSTTNGTSGFSYIDGANSISYNPPNGLQSTTWYRREVKSCEQTKYTSSISVTVLGELTEPNVPSLANNCGNTVLTKNGTPAAGTTWYWQSSEDGEDDSSEAAASTITRTSGTVYYLRAKSNNNAINCWGPARTVTYSINSFPIAPSAPSIANNCGNTVLTKNGTPATGTTWYWQSDELGEEESSQAAASSITHNSGTVYYLRGKSNDGCWGPALTINYSVNESTIWYVDADGDNFGDPNPIASIINCGQPAGYVLNDDDYDDSTENITNVSPQNFYRDIDGDGFGDPNNSVYYSSQPDGYIIDNTDQCPNVFGTINGCDPNAEDPLDQNYVYTRTYQKEKSSSNAFFTDDDAYIQEITYVDGLGRPMQQIGINQSPNNQKDIVTHIGYDQYGRIEKEWLPVYEPNGEIGSYRINDMEVTTRSYYKNHQDYGIDFPTVSGLDVNAYALKEFEASPLNRVLKQTAPGEDWKMGNGHEIKFSYQANTADEVRFFNVSTTFADNTYSPSLEENNFYAVGELYKNVIYDENHTFGKNNTTEEFTNKSGRVVLKRTYNNNEEHDTYYVYDDFGNLTFVLPPKVNTTDGISATELSELSYQYTYDHRNRLVEKQIPGKGKERIIYNKLDQPIMTQDANLAENNEWLFTKYDAFGRVAYTGKVTDNREREDIQTNSVDTFTGNLWVTQGNSYQTNGINVSYNNGAYPTSGIIELHTANYYDNYNFDTENTPVPPSVFNEQIDTSTKGLATGNRVRVLGVSPAKWITTITRYDDRARPIYTHSKNDYLGTVDIVTTELDFLGRPLKVKTTHTRNGETITTLDNFTYDNVGRLLTQTQCIGDETLGNSCPTDGSGSTSVIADLVIEDETITTNQVATNSITLLPNTTINLAVTLTIDPNARTGSSLEELIVSNTYDELGQLESKKVGGAANGNGLQTVDYNYNVRGWLKSINNTASLGDHLFAFDINYNTADHSGTKLYNGNISETEWRTANDNTLRWYRYGYDPLNRITAATDNTGKFNISVITYDKNGNIETLKREGWTTANPSLANNTGFGTMDNLVYNYDNGNKLTNVADNNASDTYGFKDVNGTGTEYVYDANGNMTSDANKGITAGGIEYNYLDMPTKITVSGSNNGTIDYVYDATGIKLRKIKTENGVTTTTDYAGNFVYEGNTLKQFYTAEGYVEPDGSSYQYVYQYTDIWGNTRLTYADDNNDGSIDASSEIRREQNYYPFGLEHKGYNNVSYGAKNNLKTYQGQEFTEDLGLNTHEWRYRIGDPATGRFWQVDPLAEDYVYNSTYAFQENKMGMGVELEGLEFVGWGLLQAASMDAAQNPNGVGAHAIGVSQGLANSVTDVVDAVANPVRTAKGLGNTAIWALAGSQFSPAIDDALGTNATATGDALMDSMVAGGEKLANGNGIERGTVIGGMVGAALGTKGSTAALKTLGTTSNVVNTVSKVEKLIPDIPEGGLLRIQNAANRIGQDINVVGSRANGTAKAFSDFDYVIEGVSSKQFGKIKNSLPGARSAIDNLPNRIDLFKGKLDKTKPHITVTPNN